MKPVCRAIALTPRPCRFNSKIITISCSPTASAPDRGIFIQPFWGDYVQHSHAIAAVIGTVLSEQPNTAFAKFGWTGGGESLLRHRVHPLSVSLSGKPGAGHLDHQPEVLHLICASNAIETLNPKICRAVRIRGHFPSDDAAAKLIYLALNAISGE